MLDSFTATSEADVKPLPDFTAARPSDGELQGSIAAPALSSKATMDARFRAGLPVLVLLEILYLIEVAMFQPTLLAAAVYYCTLENRPHYSNVRRDLLRLLQTPLARSRACLLSDFDSKPLFDDSRDARR